MKCLKCGSETNNPKYCSRSCSAKCTNVLRKKTVFCLECKKECRGRWNTYCSQKCSNKYRYESLVEQWKSGKELSPNSEAISLTIRKYLFIKFDGKCSCGWCEVNPVTGKVPLQVDHIDGNYRNNKEENLRLLCPNCHSLTPTYGNLNRGKGRKERQRKRNATVV